MVNDELGNQLIIIYLCQYLCRYLYYCTWATDLTDMTDLH